MSTRKYPAPEWRAKELIDGMKPYRRIIQRLEEKGYPKLPTTTIAGWRTINRIPGVWMPAFIDLAFESGLIKCIDDLRVRK
jgi:hypothetical protein